MPSDHISNTDYHGWLADQGKGQTGGLGLCAQCGKGLHAPRDVETKPRGYHVEGKGQVCYECWLNGATNPPPLAD